MKPPHSQLQSERQADKWDRAAAVAHAEAEAEAEALKLRTEYSALLKAKSTPGLQNKITYHLGPSRSRARRRRTALS